MSSKGEADSSYIVLAVPAHRSPLTNPYGYQFAPNLIRVVVVLSRL